MLIINLPLSRITCALQLWSFDAYKPFGSFKVGSMRKLYPGLRMPRVVQKTTLRAWHGYFQIEKIAFGFM